MRTLFISDVHANAAALEAVLAEERDHDAVVFLGDAVDCGPHPERVCERLLALDVVAGVRGNHDTTVLETTDDEAQADPFAEWQAWTNARLTAKSRAFLEGLERSTAITLDEQRLRLHHGDFEPPADFSGTWDTRTTPAEDPRIFEAIADRYGEDVIVHGHSHYPFEATVAGTTFINPGSVGLQRPGWSATRARYAVLDDGAWTLRAVSYDPEPVAADSRQWESPHCDLWEPAEAMDETAP